MENMQVKRSKFLFIGEWVISLLIFAVLVFLIKYIPFVILVLSVPGVYIAARQGALGAMLFAVAATGICYLLFFMWAIVLASVVIISMVLSSVAIKRKLRAYESLVISCLGAAIGVGVLMLYVFITTGMNITDFFFSVIQKQIGTDPFTTLGTYFIVGMEQIVKGKVVPGLSGTTSVVPTMDTIKSYLLQPEQLSLLKEIINVNLPSLLVEYAVLAGILNYFAPRAIAKKRGTRVAPVPMFSEFVLPRSISYYFLILYVLGNIPFLFEIRGLQVAGLILVSLTQIVFTIQGLSLADYFLKNVVVTKGIRILLLVLAAMMLGTILMFLGIAEQIFRFREKRFHNKTKPV